MRDAMRELPAVVKYLAEQISQGQLKFDMGAPELREIREQLKRQQKQRYMLAIAGTAIISGILVLTLSSIAAPGWALIAAGLLTAVAGRPRD